MSDGRVEDGVTPSAPPVGDLDTDVVAAPRARTRSGASCRASGAGDTFWPCSWRCGRSSWSPRRRRGGSTGGSRTSCRCPTAAWPRPVQRALTPVPVGAARQTTLVAGIDSHKNVAGTMILARVDGTRHAVEILTVPSTVSVSSSQRLRDVLRFDGVSRAIGVLERDLHVPVNHVLLIQLAQVGSIVRSLGGITISNPKRVPYDVPGAARRVPDRAGGAHRPHCAVVPRPDRAPAHRRASSPPATSARRSSCAASPTSSCT